MNDHIENRAEQTPSSEPAILQVRPNEELGGLLQRLKSEPAQSVRLVIPERAIIAQGPIALKLLADVASKLQKEVSIVSDLPQIQALARRAGLKVEGVEAGDTEGHGFVSGTDVAAAGMVPAVLPANSANPSIERSSLPGADLEANEPVLSTSGKKQFGSLFSGGKDAWVAWAKQNKVMLGVIAAFVIVALGGMVMASYYLPKATVTLYTEKRTIDRDLEVTADPDATAVDKEELIIPAKVLTATVEQTKSFAATGEDEVGEQAKGTVTIFNKTTDEVTVRAGTVIESEDKQFVLDAAVEVPAATVDVSIDPVTLEITQKTTPGKKDATIHASEIGPEYNLKGGTEFSVGNFDKTSVSARNSAAFTGGSKRTVTVVTEEDQDQALQSLVKEAQEQAEDDLRKKLSKDELLLDEAITLETESTSYSHEVGEETEKFDLTISVIATAPVVAESDLESLLTGAVEEKVPDGYKLDESDSEIENHVLEVGDDGVLQMVSTFKAQVIPVVDEEALIDEIKGQHPSAVEAFLRNQPNLSGYDISLSPKLPGPFYRLPKLESNIKVTVEVED